MAVGLALALVVALAACSSGTAEPPAPSGGLVAQVRALPFGQRSVDALRAVLVGSGVEVVDGFDSPASAPVRLTSWQVENMAAEVANGGGTSGQTLATFAPTAHGVPPIPFLVVAWMLEQGSAAAQFARALYDEQDLDDAYAMHFPDAVLALFLADATAAGSPSGSPPPAPSISASPASLTGTVSFTYAVAPLGLVDAPCSTVSNFVQKAIEAVADALTVKTSGGGFFSFLGAIWNTAVRLAARFVSGLIETLTKPVVSYLVQAFNAVAAVEQVSSVLIAWRAPLTSTPENNRFGLGDESVTGSVAMQLQPHVLPVPAAVKDCASSVGVDISATAAGSGVTWTTTATPRPDLATSTRSDQALDAREAATWQYRTGQEPADAADDPEVTGTLAVSGTIRRNDVERLRELISQLLFDQVPASLRSLVESLARPILDAATSKIAELTDVRSQTRVPITYHDVKEPCTKGKVAAGTYVGQIDTDLTGRAGIIGHATGTVTIVVDTASRTSGLLELSTQAQGGGLSMSSVEKAAISGTTAEPVLTLLERTIDGKDATIPQKGTFPPMSGECPSTLRWKVVEVPYVTAANPVVVATRTG